MATSGAVIVVPGMMLLVCGRPTVRAYAPSPGRAPLNRNVPLSSVTASAPVPSRITRAFRQCAAFVRLEDPPFDRACALRRGEARQKRTQHRRQRDDPTVTKKWNKSGHGAGASGTEQGLDVHGKKISGLPAVADA